MTKTSSWFTRLPGEMRQWWSRIVGNAAALFHKAVEAALAMVRRWRPQVPGTFLLSDSPHFTVASSLVFFLSLFVH